VVLPDFRGLQMIGKIVEVHRQARRDWWRLSIMDVCILAIVGAVDHTAGFSIRPPAAQLCAFA
jgi:hypothetical protein